MEKIVLKDQDGQLVDIVLVPVLTGDDALKCVVYNNTVYVLREVGVFDPQEFIEANSWYIRPKDEPSHEDAPHRGDDQKLRT